MSQITITVDDADVQPGDTVGDHDVLLADELHEAVARRLEEGLGIDIGEVRVTVGGDDPKRSPDEIGERLDELHAFDEYGTGPRAEYLRHKHQGWINALRWASGADIDFRRR